MVYTKNMSMKQLTILLAAILMIPSFASAQLGVAKSKKVKQQWIAEGTAGGIDYVMNGKINHDKYDKTQTSTVSFSGIPQTLDQFEELQEAIGGEPQGAVAMQVIAFEIYRRNRKLGEEAIKLNNTPTNANDCFRQLKERLGNDPNYAQPYLVAALMKGASPENGYQPERPYTITIRVNPGLGYQDSQLLDGTIIHLQIYSDGWNTPWRGIEVVQPEGADLYLVNNCPALYVGCNRMRGEWTPLEANEEEQAQESGNTEETEESDDSEYETEQ